MSRDITEQIDDICRAEYGHTNWVFTDTLSEEELEELKNRDIGIKLPSIVFYYDDKCEYCFDHYGEIVCNVGFINNEWLCLECGSKVENKEDDA